MTNGAGMGGMGMMDGMNMMGPWMMIGALIILAVVVGLAVAGGIWLGRTLSQRGEEPRRLDPDAAQEELRRRYAAGEIDREEYLQLKIEMER